MNILFAGCTSRSSVPGGLHAMECGMADRARRLVGDARPVAQGQRVST